MNMSSEYNINKKVKKYEEFLNDKLKEDLKVVHKQRDDIYKQIAEYLQLKKLIQMIQLNKDGTNKNHLKSQMDLGCNFYCQAVIPNTDYVYVAVGYSYYLQMTLDEALSFIEKKTKLLSDKSELLAKDSAKIKAHIRLVMEGLREIQNLKFDQSKVNSI